MKLEKTFFYISYKLCLHIINRAHKNGYTKNRSDFKNLIIDRYEVMDKNHKGHQQCAI